VLDIERDGMISEVSSESEDELLDDTDEDEIELLDEHPVRIEAHRIIENSLLCIFPPTM
jgi:hypothetical protein